MLLLVLPLQNVIQDSDGAVPAAGKRLGSDVPVVMILLDELPTAHLMTSDGQQIDSRRFPQIAKFASGATWYRDNVTGGDFTAWAVPSVLTGNLSNERTLPTAAAQPNNLFTLFGPGRNVHAQEEVTELCPVEICPDGRQGEAPDLTTADGFIKAKFRPFDPAEIRNWTKNIPAGRGTLSFIHAKIPHLPLRYLPTGQSYPFGALLMPSDMGEMGWSADEPAVDFVEQRHLLQTGFADRMVGEILRKIKANGDFRQAMIIFVADHGISFDPYDLRRDLTPTNVGAIANPPLIIKYPGQTAGRISTASTQSLDILPTIAQVLGAEIPSTDGQTIDKATPDRILTVSTDRMGQLQFTVDQMREDRAALLASRKLRLGERNLWKLGPKSWLIGSRPRPSGYAPKARFKLDLPFLVKQASSSRRQVPAMVGGVLHGIEVGKTIALAWGDRIVATTRSFYYKDRIRFGAMVHPSVMKRGQNKIRLYLVGPGNRQRLIP